MKRILTIICCLSLLLGIVPFCVSASETASQNMQTVEYLEDGSYIVTELEVTPAVARRQDHIQKNPPITRQAIQQFLQSR